MVSSILKRDRLLGLECSVHFLVGFYLLAELRVLCLGTPNAFEGLLSVKGEDVIC